MFIESAVWDGLKNGSMDEVLSMIGPSIAVSKRSTDEKAAVKKEYTQQHRDKVKFFDSEKGYGKTRSGAFLHVSRFVKNQGEYTSKGVTVVYDIEVDTRSGREVATNIEIVSEG